MSIREVLAHNLRRYRALRGLSQEELAHRADIDRTYISSLERQQYGATIDVVEKLADVLEVSVSDLLKPEDESSGSSPDKRSPARWSRRGVLAGV